MMVRSTLDDAKNQNCVCGCFSLLLRCSDKLTRRIFPLVAAFRQVGEADFLHVSPDIQ